LTPTLAKTVGKTNELSMSAAVIASIKSGTRQVFNFRFISNPPNC
jgi:hypothetical protein